MLGVTIEVLVEEIGDGLTGGVVGITRQPIQDATADQRVRRAGHGRIQGAQPAFRRLTIVVEKRKELTASMGGAIVTRGCWAEIRLPYDRHTNRATMRFRYRLKIRRAAIVDQDDLEFIARIFEARERV